MREPHLLVQDSPPRMLGRLLVVSALVSATLLVAPRAAGAQEPIDSTTALKRACEAAVNDFLYVTTDVKITKGPHENVASACQIALGPAASFEAVGVSMRFAGSFRIDSSRERSISFTTTAWEAPSMEFYGGAVSSFRSIASRLRAGAGDITIGAGSESKLELQDRPAGSVNGIEAAGSVSIYGGGKLSVSLRDTGIQAGRGVQVSLDGIDSVLTAEHAELRSLRGPLNLSAGGRAFAELKGVTLASSGGNATVSLAGTDSLLKAESTRISSQGGSVNLTAGGNGSWAGVELVEATVTATRGVIVQGSSGSSQRYGTVKVAKSTVSGGSDVILRSGTFGATEVKESSLRSTTSIRVLTGTGGTCSAEKNSYQAPVQRICS